MFAKTRSDAPASRCQPPKVIAVSKGGECGVMEDKKSPHIFGQKTVQFLLTILHAHPVARVHDPHQSVRLFEIVTPIGSQGPLATHIPWSDDSDLSERRNWV